MNIAIIELFSNKIQTASKSPVNDFLTYGMFYKLCRDDFEFYLSILTDKY